MSTGQAGLQGQAPVITRGKVDPAEGKRVRPIDLMSEKAKYTKMWTVPDYRKVSPGELAGSTFMAVAQPEKGEKVIDFGCGTGRGSFYLAFMGAMDVTMLDFAPNCLDDDVKLAAKNQTGKLNFIEHDLMEDSPVFARYGYCTDVMEHIPTADVDRVLLNILSSARSVFFRISTEPDVMGPAYLNTPLHLTVQNYGWWAAKLLELDCTILHSENLGGAVDFYVTAWKQTLPNMEVNTVQPQILANIRENAKWPVNKITAHQIQDDVDVMLLCGGPSLSDFEDEIIEKWKAGTKVVTVNGAYNWALERGITNVNQCMLDARPFNKRFVEPARDDCYYFIGSQCDPSVFESLPHDRTFIWHCNTAEETVKLTNELYDEPAFCNGGSTVVSRAIVLLRVLGFKNQTIYGMDSCIFGDEHHAYPQLENEIPEPEVPVMVGDRTFICAPWMALQAFEFIRLIEHAGDEFSLTVKGDGLIAHILETGATLPLIKEL